MCVTGIHGEKRICSSLRKTNNLFDQQYSDEKEKFKTSQKLMWYGISTDIQVSFFSLTIFVMVHHHLDIVHHQHDNYLLIVHLFTSVSLHPTPRASKLQSAGHLRIFKSLTFTYYLMIDLQNSCFNNHFLHYAKSTVLLTFIKNTSLR